MRLVLIIIALFYISISVEAQIAETGISAGLNVLVPLSNKDYIGKGKAGVRLSFTKFINEKFGFGFEGGYNTLDDYVPPLTYELPGGAITTDVYNYMYHFTIGVNGQYYFLSNARIVPYGSLGLGVAFSEYKLFYNVYSDSDSKTGFLARPEAGVLYRWKPYSNFGLKAAVSYEFATVKSDYFELDNFSGIGVQVGIILFND